MSNQIAIPNPVVITDPSGRVAQSVGQFIAPMYAAVTLNAASGTTPQTVVTAPAGQYIYVLGIQITLDATCTLGSAGMINTTLVDSSGPTVAILRSWLPASFTAPTGPTVLRQTSAPGAFYGSPGPGSTLSCSNSVALTAGSIRVSFNYGFSAVPFIMGP